MSLKQFCFFPIIQNHRDCSLLQPHGRTESGGTEAGSASVPGSPSPPLHNTHSTQRKALGLQFSKELNGTEEGACINYDFSHSDHLSGWKGIIWMPMASSSSACWRPGLGKLGFISVIWPAGFYKLQRARVPLTSQRWYGLAACSLASPGLSLTLLPATVQTSFFQITSTTRAGNHAKERTACFLSNSTGNSNSLFAQSDLLNVNVCH